MSADTTAELLALELVEIRRRIAEDKAREAELIQALADAMPAKRLELPGVGVFERHKSSSRKAWKNDDLQSLLVRKLRAGEVPKQVDPETGEVLDEDDIARTARVLNDCARPSWRLTPLRALGIDPDEYVETTYDGTWTIQFSGVQS